MVVNKDEMVEELQSEIENQMLLVGSTAIEDRLQDEVAETICAFKESGIKVWVLTGDKVETAINIGYSAGLLSNEMEQSFITTTIPIQIHKQLQEIFSKKAAIVLSRKKAALVISGEALTQV